MPNPGGVFQQDPKHIKRLSIVYGILNKVESEMMKAETAQATMQAKLAEGTESGI